MSNPVHVFSASSLHDSNSLASYQQAQVLAEYDHTNKQLAAAIRERQELQEQLAQSQQELMERQQQDEVQRQYAETLGIVQATHL